MTHLAPQATADGLPAVVVGLRVTLRWAGMLLASTAAHVAVQRLGRARVFVGATALATMAARALDRRPAIYGERRRRASWSTRSASACRSAPLRT
ncbi:MAG: hypothetical protein ACK57B_14295 [Betaproteobacteria bacterium]